MAGKRDDILQLYFLCEHPSLTPPSAVALTRCARSAD
jgi:predicted RNA polymerase sigma factor